MKIGIQKTVEVEAIQVRIYLKVCDSGTYILYDQHGDEIWEHEGYVPDWIPGEYGDYIDLRINLETGQIENWKTPTPAQIQDTLNGND